MTTKSSKLRQGRQRFVSRSSHPKVLRLCWGRIQETTVKNPYAPHPRVRSPLKPNITYYGFLEEEWSLQTSWVAHNRSWAITSMPSCLGEQAPRVINLNLRAWPKPSAQQMGMRLTSTNPCSCFTLTQIPQRNNSRMERGECESFSWFRLEFSSSNGQEKGLKGHGGVFIPLHSKTSRWRRVTQKLPSISPETPG